MKVKKNIITNAQECIDTIHKIFQSQKIKYNKTETALELRFVARQLGVKEYELVLFVEENAKEIFQINREVLFEIPDKEKIEKLTVDAIEILKKGSYHGSNSMYFLSLANELQVDSDYMKYVLLNLSDKKERFRYSREGGVFSFADKYVKSELN